MKNLLNTTKQLIVAAAFLAAASIQAAPATTIPLVRNGTQVIGNVTVTSDPSFVYVKFTASAGWTLTQTYLDVRNVPNLFPLTTTGNLDLTRFGFQATHASVTEFTYFIAASTIDTPTPVFAAHAIMKSCTTGGGSGGSSDDDDDDGGSRCRTGSSRDDDDDGGSRCRTGSSRDDDDDGGSRCRTGSSRDDDDDGGSRCRTGSSRDDDDDDGGRYSGSSKSGSSRYGGSGCSSGGSSHSSGGSGCSGSGSGSSSGSCITAAIWAGGTTLGNASYFIAPVENTPGDGDDGDGGTLPPG